MLPWWVWVGAVVLCAIIAACINGGKPLSSAWTPQEEAGKPQGPAGQALARLDRKIDLMSQLGSPPASLYQYLVEELDARRMEASWVTPGDLQDLASKDALRHYDSTVALIRARIFRAMQAE